MINTNSIIDSALRWALDHLGSPDYPGRCYAFCEDAYELGGSIILDGQGATAKEAADAYRAHDRPDGTPPRGAYVFYDCHGPIRGETRNWGHMGLSLGDGRIVHTWSVVRVDELRAVEGLQSPDWTKPVYIGWAPPEVLLKGMKVP